MKKLRIKDTKLFKQQITTIAIMLIATIITIAVGTYLKLNGIESLFTIHAYEEAFETTSSGIALINHFEILFLIFIFVLGIQELKDNKQIQDLKREGEELCMYLSEH